MRRLAVRSQVVLALLAVACGPGTTVAPEGGESAKAGFENPGGMWMPAQMSAHADTLKSIGLEIDPADLADPTASPLGAVVSLGGCSASFVSPDGLIVTNHHCVTRILQYNSTPENNLLENGFLAKDKSEEKWAGPTQRVYVTKSFTNVTEEILGGLESVTDPAARSKEIESRVKARIASCEAAHADTRCRVAGYYEGAEFYEIQQLELRDIRLVYAPHQGIGVFGGEIDNWRWPRHTGDFSFLRAYVGADGRPADHADDNKPYAPEHVLKVATDKIEPGDFVMVAGYPGRTQRLKTAGAVKDAVEFVYPWRIEMFQQYLAAIDEVAKVRPEAGIKAASTRRGLSNYLTNYRGMLDGLVKGGLADSKAKMEAELQSWINADPARKEAYGGVLEQMAAIRKAEAATRVRDTTFSEVLGASRLLGAAQTIVKLAGERPKPDAERASGYQERDWARLEQGLRALDARYDAQLDARIVKLFVERAATRAPEDQPKALLEGLGLAGATGEELDKRIAALYGATKLGDVEARVKLLNSATEASLKKSKDPFIRAALAVKPLVEAKEAEDRKVEGQLSLLRPKYIAALREFTGKPLAPDANGTLRVTYGTVRGYRPTPEAETYVPFSTVDEMVAKHTGQAPFAAPEQVLKVAKNKNYGSYAAEFMGGQMPLDFLADLDITGGNSGSATLNARGELVGLVFDGNYEAMASDWIFMPEITRSIHVDLRYVLWVMDAVDQADWLLEEMSVKPHL